MSPLSSGSGAPSSTASYQPGYSHEATSAENIVSNTASLYSQSSLSWNDRMAFTPNPRIPAMLPSAHLPRSFQGPGNSMTSGGSSIVGRDNYPTAYTLSTRNSYPSPSSVNDMSRYSYNTTLPSGIGAQLDPPTPYYPGFGHSHRSGQPDAPLFTDISIIHPIMTSNHTEVQPNIIAKIHKGFFQVDNKWTCYRRNYFSVTCSFSLHPYEQNATYYVQTHDQPPEPIKKFAMSISAVVNSSEHETRDLVQHTPKRDKQSERKPEKVVLQPQYPAVLASNTGPPSAPLYGSLHPGNIPFDYSQYPIANSQITQHTFERIQFQKATANNGKRRAQQQYYNLVVELYAHVSGKNGEKYMQIAKRLSDPMVVRGRSPGHYKDSRRDSSTSMGDNGGHGGFAGDPGHHSLPAQQSMRQQSSYAQLPFSMPYDSRREAPHYSSHNRQIRVDSFDHSPEDISPGTLISSSSSSPFDSFLYSDAMDSEESGDALSHDSSQYQDDMASSLRKKPGKHAHHHHHHNNICEETEIRSGFDDSFDPMIPSYNSEQEEQQYLKHTIDRRLAPILHENAQVSRSGSYSRFDPVQNSLCA
ncbi:hypothetical protein BGW36DRAFT_59687 [Talaromyces proteolyticus]|uniref:NDT80 domain-containing protein n=1 Tax=Talaromyces proteolyticus TaxID=1131652 RepID=A0AAD4PVW8_9EURO|nr:uncharacterized protein BGW36DRAFT_59687 [Talaromyces proteolyticus]KAH8690775.1 hypothetical protein BGW36DRAFT_59687 [Talaromyces proteolyticus]